MALSAGSAASTRQPSSEGLAVLSAGGWVEDWVATCPRQPALSERCGVYLLVRDAIDLRTPANDSDADVRPQLDEILDAATLRLLRLDRRVDEGSLVQSENEQIPGAPGYLLQILLEDLPPRSRLAALDLDRDGIPEPLVVVRGEAFGVRETSRGGVRLDSLLREADAPASGLLSSLDPFAEIAGWASVGKVSFFEVLDGQLQRLGRVDLPVSARLGAATLRLESPPLRRVSRAEDGAALPVFAVGPEEAGPGRWRVQLFRPLERASGTEQGEESDQALRDERDEIFSEEIWLRTPEIERPEAAEFLEWNGRLVLLAQALRADKVGVVERKKIRLYPLRSDRTRAGVRASFEHLSVSRLWQDLGTVLADHDGDGNLELTVFQREGYSGRKLQIEQFDSPSGQIDSRGGRPQLVKLPWPEWNYTADLTGDGVRDLLLQSGGLFLMAGRGQGAKVPFESSAAWHLPLPEARPSGVEVSIDIGEAEDEPLDPEAEAALQRDEVSQENAGISWGAPRLLLASQREVALLGSRGSAYSGGEHLLLIAPVPP